MAAYGALDRLLHRAALGVAPLAELAFDLDQKAARPDPATVAAGRHVFVAGLARAGTTVLMRRFHGQGVFRALTYRDMPFVLAPNLWRRVAALSQRTRPAAQRAHGDRILVDLDSPEGLDEVFWRVFDGPRYITRTHLLPHDPDAETLDQYVRYVGAILRAGPQPATRYLSKTNTSILRLPALRRAFPRALLLVPFRAPLAQAASLHRQHHLFQEAQARDPFIRTYMSWLGHHEFGQDHRPARFDAAGAARLAALTPDGPDYWLEVWAQAYGWLARTAPPEAVFVCYEDLCRDPDVWAGLAARAGLAPGDSAGAAPFVAGADADGTGKAADPDRLAAATALYHRLVQRARAARSAGG